jgi:hypothetical protein
VENVIHFLEDRENLGSEEAVGVRDDAEAHGREVRGSRAVEESYRLSAIGYRSEEVQSDALGTRWPSAISRQQEHESR